jgi:hypothetical protein
MNQSYLTEEFYQTIGSTWIIDGINFYLVSPIGLIGFLLNLSGLCIMLKIHVNTTKLYIYLRYYCLNSALICLICGFTFVAYSPRYFSYFNNYYAIFYRCRIFNFVASSLYFYGNILDILVALERLSIFIPPLKAYSRAFSSLKIMIPIVIACFVININNYLSNYVLTQPEFDQEAVTNSSSFTYCGKNEYFYSQTRKIIAVLLVIIRDILTIIIETVLSILCIYYYRNYSTTSISTNVNTSRITVGKRLLRMTLAILFLSNLSHLVIATTYLSSFNSNSIFLLGSYLTCSAGLSISLKHFSNFIIFFFFNTNFRNIVRCVSDID